MTTANDSEKRQKATNNFIVWKTAFDAKAGALDLNKVGLNAEPGVSKNYIVEGEAAKTARRSRIERKVSVGALYADPRYATLDMAFTGETSQLDLERMVWRKICEVEKLCEPPNKEWNLDSIADVQRHWKAIDKYFPGSVHVPPPPPKPSNTGTPSTAHQHSGNRDVHRNQNGKQRPNPLIIFVFVNLVLAAIGIGLVGGLLWESWSSPAVVASSERDTHDVGSALADYGSAAGGAAGVSVPDGVLVVDDVSDVDSAEASNEPEAVMSWLLETDEWCGKADLWPDNIEQDDWQHWRCRACSPSDDIHCRSSPDRAERRGHGSCVGNDAFCAPPCGHPYYQAYVAGRQLAEGSAGFEPDSQLSCVDAREADGLSCVEDHIAEEFPHGCSEHFRCCVQLIDGE